MHDPSTIASADLFAEYTPREVHVERIPRGLVIRSSELSDRDALAQIAWQRNGGELADYIARFERDLVNCPNSPDDLWLTAMVDRAPVGYAKVLNVLPGDDAPLNAAPRGYYLGGVTVAPEFRRQGIGLELTRRRLDWISQCATEAYYFANARNLASIDLHAKLGFVELTRDFHIPGASFVGGLGILFRLTFSGGAQHRASDL